LLLAEILYDIAAAVPTDPIVVWEVEVFGDFMSPDRQRFFVEQLKIIAPDAKLIGVRRGSTIFKFLSSSKTFMTLQRLANSQVLSVFLEVEKMYIFEPKEDDLDPFYSPGKDSPIDLLIRIISEWRPRSEDSAANNEEHLFRWMLDGIEQTPVLTGSYLIRDTVVTSDSGAHQRIDFGFMWRTDGDDIALALIELVRVRTRSAFLQRLEKLLQTGREAILVVVAEYKVLYQMNDDIERLSRITSKVRVVIVPLDKG
jgi:hypothetical protein